MKYLQGLTLLSPLLILALLAGALPVAFSAAYDANSTLNVHLIAHSHDDIGWLKTVDEYYYGYHNDIQNAGVQYILDSVIAALNKKSDRKFIEVEIGFFYRWWNNADDDTRDRTRKLIKNGQLEFINAGWCMHDEANPYYEDMIGNMAIGHQFLKDTFNVTPTIGWHIDPFGHSAASAALYAQMGFDGFIFSRIDHEDMDARLAQKNMEMLWVPKTSQGAENQIFTAITYPSLYTWPQEPHNLSWDFNWFRSADAVNDNPKLEGYNVDQQAQWFVEYFVKEAESFRTNDIMKTMGMDFEYQAAHIDFKNMDKLLKYIKNRSDLYPNINIFYSTPSIYVQALQSKNVTFPTKEDDFFPYSDDGDSYWTGYYTSRVAVKGHVRQTGRYFQNVRRLVTQKLWRNESSYLRKNGAAVTAALAQLEMTMGVLQHHDAIAGTEKQKVADDYQFLLYRDKMRVHTEITKQLFNEEVNSTIGPNNYDFQLCDTNVTASLCNATAGLSNGANVLIGVYNSLNNGSRIVRVKVPTGKVSVTDTLGKSIQADVICANTTDSKDCDLFFRAQLDGHKITFFYLVPSPKSNEVVAQDTIPTPDLYSRYQVGDGQYITVYSDFMNFEWEEPNFIIPFTIRYNYYGSYCAKDQQNSGAYIFRPTNSTLNNSLPYTAPILSKIYQGKVLTQIYIENQKILTNLRFYKGSNQSIEIESFVAPIDISDNLGKEIVLLIKTNIQNNQTFHTDANGIEMQKRVLNYRPTWNLTVTQPISGNYYPINSAIFIEDAFTNTRATLVTDRTHGGTSAYPGEIELMLHRRIICDDGRGVEEALNETENLSGLTQWFTQNLIFTTNEEHSQQRLVQLQNDQPLLSLLAPLPLTNSNIPTKKNHVEIMLDDSFSLPETVKVLAKPYNQSCHAIWLQNMDEFTTVTVSTDYFTNAILNGTPFTLTEVTLSANQPKAEAVNRKLQWQNTGEYKVHSEVNTDYKAGTITLRPLEIRTFQIDITWSK